MIVLAAVIEAKDGKEWEMETALREAVMKVQAEEEGTLEYALHRAQNNPRKFFVYEKYRDNDALAIHTIAPYIQELFEKIGPIMEGDPDVEMYEVLASK